MVTKALHEVAETVSDAFSPRPRQSRLSHDTLGDIRKVRRLSCYHRDRYLKESRRRRRTAISANEVEMAVLRALRQDETKG